MARVLVVDDEPSVTFALESMLQLRGDTAVVANSGEEALAQLDGVDVVVTDYAMPGMDGLELLRVIREHDPSLPVILLTAQGSEKIAARAIRSGAYEYVTKPFDLDEMSLLMDRALGARSLGIENRSR